MKTYVNNFTHLECFKCKGMIPKGEVHASADTDMTERGNTTYFDAKGLAHIDYEDFSFTSIECRPVCFFLL